MTTALIVILSTIVIVLSFMLNRANNKITALEESYDHLVGTIQQHRKSWLSTPSNTLYNVLSILRNKQHDHEEIAMCRSLASYIMKVK